MSALLARVRAAAPATHWETALPARVAGADPAGTLERIARRVRIELEDARETLVVLNDESRETDPALVATLLRAALAASKKVSVLFARGSHPLPTPDAHVDAVFAHLSLEERRSLAVSHHDARRSPFVGVAGVPLHRAVAETEHVVALGSVEPHYFAGWTGAHKTATIGVMGLEAIEENHARAIAPASRPLARDGNPVFDGIAAVADALGERLFCVNEVLAQGRLVAWSAGLWRSALEQVVPEAEAAFVREIDAPVGLLVASVSGPLGRTLYQAEKGIKNSESCVAEGGAVVLSAPCTGGIGQARFIELLAAARSVDEARAKVDADGYRLGDHKAIKLRALEARGISWHLACPGIAAFPDEARRVREAGLALHATLEEAIAAAGPRERGLLVEDAGNLVARLAAPKGG